MTTPSNTPTAAAAGWYPDHARPSTQRYWDGASWTDQVRTANALPRLPSIATIWINLIFFGWAFGIGLFYAYYLCIRGVVAKRARGESPLVYVIPMLMPVVVVVALVILVLAFAPTSPSPSY